MFFGAGRHTATIHFSLCSNPNLIAEGGSLGSRSNTRGFRHQIGTERRSDNGRFSSFKHRPSLPASAIKVGIACGKKVTENIPHPTTYNSHQTTLHFRLTMELRTIYFLKREKPSTECGRNGDRFVGNGILRRLGESRTRGCSACRPRGTCRSSDRRRPPRRRCGGRVEEEDELVLDRVGVLVLVDHHVLEAALVVVEQVGAALEQE